MSHTQHNTYYVKLNRFFNIQAKKSLICLAVLVAVVVLYVAINLMQNTFDIRGLLITVIGCALIMTAALLSNPKCLTVTPETIKFQYRGAFFNLLTTGRVKYSSNEDSRYEKTYTLYNIKSIEYFQTPLEKTFSCGHVRICGNVDAAGEQTFVIYGVKDFENTTKWMRSYIDTEADKDDMAEKM